MYKPNDLAELPSIQELSIPEYDWVTQTRFDSDVIAGSYTNNSIQTFDSKGKPSDAKSDKND